MKAVTKIRMSAGERRDQLLRTAASLVDETGFHGVSIEAVARRAGVTRPVIYEHFGSLTGLLEALVAREGALAEAQLARMLPRPDAGVDPAELLLGSLRAYLEAVQADPVTWRLVLMPPEGAPAVLRETVAAARERAVAQLALAAAAGAGPAPGSPDPELTGRMLSTIADETARLVLTDPERYPVERVLAHARWLLESLRR